MCKMWPSQERHKSWDNPKLWSYWEYFDSETAASVWFNLTLIWLFSHRFVLLRKSFRLSFRREVLFIRSFTSVSPPLEKRNSAPAAWVCRKTNDFHFSIIDESWRADHKLPNWASFRSENGITFKCQININWRETRNIAPGSVASAKQQFQWGCLQSASAFIS